MNRRNTNEKTICDFMAMSAGKKRQGGIQADQVDNLFAVA